MKHVLSLIIISKALNQVITRSKSLSSLICLNSFISSVKQSKLQFDRFWPILKIGDYWQIKKKKKDKFSPWITPDEAKNKLSIV